MGVLRRLALWEARARGGWYNSAIDATLSCRTERPHHMADYIEGKRPVIEAFRTGVPMRRYSSRRRPCKKRDSHDRGHHAQGRAQRRRRSCRMLAMSAGQKSARGSASGRHGRRPAPFRLRAASARCVDAANSYAEEHRRPPRYVVLRDRLADAGNLGADQPLLRGRGRIAPDHPQQAQRTRSKLPRTKSRRGRHHARACGAGVRRRAEHPPLAGGGLLGVRRNRAPPTTWCGMRT